MDFKTHNPSYKSKKLSHRQQDEWTIFEDAYKPIIDRAKWEKIQ